MNYDVIIIGGGPGGYTGAFEAADAKLKVCLMEERELGGTCLNRGCIPTKTLVHSADLFRSMKNPEMTAIETDGMRLNSSLLNQKKDRIVEQLRSGIEKALKSAGIDVITGHAAVIAPHIIEINGQRYEAENIVIATGSEPLRIPVEGADLPGVITSDDILKDVPQFDSLVIIGGGVIGCEIAGIYEAFGTKVTVIEAMDRLLPNIDSECGRSLALLMKKRGTEVHCKAMVRKIAQNETGLTVFYEEKNETKTVDADAVLMAAGRKAHTDCFACEAPAANRGRLIVNEFLETGMENVYAIGDAADGYPQLAHTAMAMAVNAVCHISGQEPKRDMNCIVSGVYTSPEIATVGIGEKEAGEKGISAISGKVNTLANARSLIATEDRGFVRITAEKETGRLLGAVMMCERATDLIQELADAIVNGLTCEDVLKTIHGHPTFSELTVSALEALKKKR